MMSSLLAESFFYLRIPILSLQQVLLLFESDGQDNSLLKAYIRSLLSSPDFLAAIHTASPELHRHTKLWLQGNLPQRREKRVLLSLYKYILRAGARSTPFGRFAGCVRGSITSAASAFDLQHASVKIYSSLNMEYALKLSDSLCSRKDIYTQLSFYTNKSLCLSAGYYHFYCYSLDGTAEFYQLQSVPESPLMKQIAKWADKGIPYHQLLKRICRELKDSSAAEKFIDKLKIQQFLVTDLYPQITGDVFFDRMHSRIKKLQQVEDIANDLDVISAAVKNGGAEDELTVRKKLSQYFTVGEKDVFQQNQVYEARDKFNLNKLVAAEITGYLDELLCLGETYQNTNLTAFKQQFSERYSDRAIPFLQVFDPFCGVGYGYDKTGPGHIAPDLSSLALPKAVKSNDFCWTKKHQHILYLLTDALEKGNKSIILTPADLSMLSGPGNHCIPESLYAVGNLLAEGPETDTGNFRFVLHQLGGPSAGNMLARFCHEDASLNADVISCLAGEQGAINGVICAEVVHLPEPRLGNVVSRPVLRPYEIPLITRAGVGSEFEISPDDLTIAVRNDRIILFSQKLGKEIIPRITNAHNFANGIPMYRFLGDLQYQGFNLFHSWSWHPFHKQPFLPRVVYRKVILQRARWCIKKAEFELWRSKHQAADFRIFIQEFNALYSTPELVVLKEGDHELLLNLSCAHSLDIIAAHLLKKDLFIYEFVFEPENCIVKRAAENYVHELILPLQAAGQNKKRILPGPDQLAGKPCNTFTLGSSWLYFKIYLNYEAADLVIGSLLLPLTRRLLAEGFIEQWFFIRYKDPDYHIRLRFHHTHDAVFWKTVIEQLNETMLPAIQNGIVRKITTDTYEQEAARYGADIVPFAEQFFFYDSAAMAELICLFSQSPEPQAKIRTALKSIDLLLIDFGFDLQEKLEFITTLSDYFFEGQYQHSEEKLFKVSLDRKYRAAAADIQGIMTNKGTSAEATFFECLQRRSVQQSTIIRQMKKVLDTSTGSISLAVLVSSLVHMSMNRLFTVNQRQHELVAYYYLKKYYGSVLARLQLHSSKNISY